MNTKNEKKAGKARKAFIDLGSRNFQIFGLGIIVLIAGYIALSIGPADSFWSLTLAPILLLVAYCVIVPVAIFWRSKKQSV